MSPKEAPVTITSVGDGTAQRRNDSEAQAGNSTKRMTWYCAALILTSATNSLGLLSLPRALAPLGIVPSALLILFIGLLDWYTGYLVYLFARRHPDATSYTAMMCKLFGGKYWRLLFGSCLGGFMQTGVLIMIMSAHLIGWGVMVEVFSDGRIPVKLGAVTGVCVMALCNLSRSLKDGVWLAMISCVSIVAAIIVAGVSVAVSNGDFSNGYVFVPEGHTTLAVGAKAVTSLLFVFMGHIAYPNVIAEMKNPQHFSRALRLQSIVTTILSEIVAIYFYAAVGIDVESPVLGSASRILRIVAYTLAIPTIMVAAVISCSIAARPIYEALWKLLKRPEIIANSTFTAKSSWFLLVAALWTIALLICEVIPTFEVIVPFVGAIFGPLFCLIFPPLFWMRMHGPWSTMWRELSKRKLMTALNIIICIIGVFTLVIGLYGSIADFSRAAREVKIETLVLDQ